MTTPLGSSALRMTVVTVSPSVATRIFAWSRLNPTTDGTATVPPPVLAIATPPTTSAAMTTNATTNGTSRCDRGLRSCCSGICAVSSGARRRVRPGRTTAWTHHRSGWDRPPHRRRHRDPGARAAAGAGTHAPRLRAPRPSSRRPDSALPDQGGPLVQRPDPGDPTPPARAPVCVGAPQACRSRCRTSRERCP